MFINKSKTYIVTVLCISMLLCLNGMASAQLSCEGWSFSYGWFGKETDGDGAGISLYNIDNDPRPEMILMVYDKAGDLGSYFRFTIGRNLDSRGITRNWGDIILLGGVDDDADGVGLCVYDVNNDGHEEMIMMAYTPYMREKMDFSVIVGFEECNSFDDDCDGLADEDLKRDCNTICGQGYETCQKGQWVNCTAPQPELSVCG